MNISPLIAKTVNNPRVMKFASDPVWPIAGLIVTNAVFRPVFTLADKNTSPEAKKYSATREFFHQILCLGAHFTLAEGFKKIGFKLGKVLAGKSSSIGFDKFSSYGEVKQFIKNGGDLMKKYPYLNGSLAVGSILGSIVALAVIAPKLNNILLPPILKTLGVSTDDSANNDKKADIIPLRRSTKDELLIPKNFTHLQLMG